jgi:hypothetical protein
MTPVRNCIASRSRNSTTCQIREHLPTIRRQLPASGSYSHEVSSSTFTAQATSNAAASTVCTPSIPVLNNAFMAGKASCDSSSGVSNLIFPVIQDSFTFDSGLPTGRPRGTDTSGNKKGHPRGMAFSVGEIAHKYAVCLSTSRLPGHPSRTDSSDRLSRYARRCGSWRRRYRPDLP